MLTIPYSPSAYQEDLGSISSQIQTLQEQSLSMNIKLKNRQVSKKHLFIDFLLHKSSEARRGGPPIWNGQGCSSSCLGV